jgi:uncharacterized protein (DUF1330 family)
MTAYLIVDFDIRDQAAFQNYAKGVVPLIGKLGGKVLAAGGAFEVIDGPWQPHRLALIQFPDRATISALFAHPEYAELDAIRKRNFETVLVAVDGVDVTTDIRDVISNNPSSAG